MTKITYRKYDIIDLVKLSQEGDIKALEELIRKIQKQVFGLFSHLTDKKEDISDLTQEALLKMAKNIKSLRDISSFKLWLNKIITNTFYDYSRKKNYTQIEFNDKILDELKDKIGCEPGEKCLFLELQKIIKNAILALPNSLKIAIILREYEGLSYDDISKVTNTTLGTVKSRISRARFKLQDVLKEFI